MFSGFCSTIFAVNTWPFLEATETAFQTVSIGGSSIDAVVAGCTTCEEDQCDGTVGWGGSPDENGHTTLDALVMEGSTQDMGAVIQLKSVREAARVAKAVLDHSYHSILVGENATNFAIGLGFEQRNLATQSSINKWQAWRENACQPNFWRNMVNSTTRCGPYQPKLSLDDPPNRAWSNKENHDTIGMIARDRDGNMAVGTSTNGANHKIAGRASDSAVPGAGAYVENGVGGAVSTGDGDVMMRFSPAFHTVLLMEGGVGPEDSAKKVIARIARKYPNFSGAVVAAADNGTFGAACHGFSNFQYCVRDEKSDRTQLLHVKCTGVVGDGASVEL